MRFLPLLAGVLVLAGCVVPPAPPPIPPVPPPPEPVEPVEPPEPSGLTRESFAHVEVGDPISEALTGLPPANRTTITDGGKTIYAWRLDEQRPSGGYVWWEIHELDKTVTFSGAW
jgi:hypothetical protein